MHKRHYLIFFFQNLHGNAEIMEEFKCKLMGTCKRPYSFIFYIKSLRLSVPILVCSDNKNADQPLFMHMQKLKELVLYFIAHDAAQIRLVWKK